MRPAALIFATFILTGATLAQTAQPITLTLTRDLVRTVTQNGKSTEQITANVKSVLPGDTFIENLTVRNTTTKARNLTVRLPVPKAAQYIGNATPSSNRWQVQFSADGGKTFAAAPLKQTIIDNGIKKEVVVPINKYTDARWIITGLKPDESLKFNFRAQVK
ncbi:hypothetical protein [Deinococcus maricopensis]|uniref:DUF11 domain-containing protein n=1 Tax=Deinococcus maricopensis (strain DSM 21211 / LMG 22137 / NRRL B-23946 / LB-34) TaxID=709986 RepID=E8U6B6_DEIML|nr:hypothetical protein [Deinococcus maricopensis]ADV66605.1 hypothetical protein Deima_0952 [Deinococcus maricopensis DSM 21211]